LWERLYLPQIFGGLMIVIYRFWRNLLLHLLHAVGIAKDVRASMTVQYPDEHKHYPDNFRGSHRLTLKEDGSVRCTACFLCATACPAHCIFIEAGEHPDPTVEKFPLRYEIDTLRCIYCGMCVEACPCDAIRMDTYVHPKIWGYKRADFIETKEVFIARSKALAERGRQALMDDLLEDYKRQEEEEVRGARPAERRPDHHGKRHDRPYRRVHHRVADHLRQRDEHSARRRRRLSFVLGDGDAAQRPDGEFRRHDSRRPERPDHPSAACAARRPGGGA